MLGTLNLLVAISLPSLIDLFIQQLLIQLL